MNFTEKYTTAEKIAADKEGKEEKKTSLSNDAFAIGEMLNAVIHKLEQLRKG